MKTTAPYKSGVRSGGSHQHRSDSDLHLARTLQRASEIAAQKAARADQIAPRKTGATYLFVTFGVLCMSMGLMAMLSTLFTGQPLELPTLGITALGALAICSAPRPKNSTKEIYSAKARELAQLSASLNQS